MLYKFKSKASGDLIMHEPNGRRLLQIMGKDAGVTGIILPEEMASAMAALKVAVEHEEAQQKAALEEAKAKGEPPPGFDSLSLRRRAWPFIEMLQRCAKENAAITWGV
jgi:Domain of unknown function (DUF1840)